MAGKGKAVERIMQVITRSASSSNTVADPPQHHPRIVEVTQSDDEEEAPVQDEPTHEDPAAAEPSSRRREDTATSDSVQTLRQHVQDAEERVKLLEQLDELNRRQSTLNPSVVALRGDTTPVPLPKSKS